MVHGARNHHSHSEVHKTDKRISYHSQKKKTKAMEDELSWTTLVLRISSSATL